MSEKSKVSSWKTTGQKAEWKHISNEKNRWDLENGSQYAIEIDVYACSYALELINYSIMCYFFHNALSFIVLN